MQIAIGLDQISEISISMLHAFSRGSIRDLFKINVACSP